MTLSRKPRRRVVAQGPALRGGACRIDSSTLGHTTLNASGKYQWLREVILFGMVYLCRGRCIPQSVCPKRDTVHVAAGRVVDQRRCVCDSHWDRTLSTSELASQNSRSRCCGGCAGAFALAAAANIHALSAGTGNHSLLALALVIWPIMTGVPAFVVASVAAAGLARVRSNDNQSGVS